MAGLEALMGVVDSMVARKRGMVLKLSVGSENEKDVVSLSI
jgi:hypothetical protein